MYGIISIPNVTNNLCLDCWRLQEATRLSLHLEKMEILYLEILSKLTQPTLVKLKGVGWEGGGGGGIWMGCAQIVDQWPWLLRKTDVTYVSLHCHSTWAEHFSLRVGVATHLPAFIESFVWATPEENERALSCNFFYVQLDDLKRQRHKPRMMKLDCSSGSIRGRKGGNMQGEDTVYNCNRNTLSVTISWLQYYLWTISFINIPSIMGRLMVTVHIHRPQK